MLRKRDSKSQHKIKAVLKTNFESLHKARKSENIPMKLKKISDIKSNIFSYEMTDFVIPL